MTAVAASPLSGLEAATFWGAVLVIAGLAAAIAALAIGANAFLTRKSVLGRDQLVSAARLMLAFAAFTLLLGALLLLAVPAIETADPARRPPSASPAGGGETPGPDGSDEESATPSSVAPETGPPTATAGTDADTPAPGATPSPTPPPGG